jgi:hypothetical protein
MTNLLVYYVGCTLSFSSTLRGGQFSIDRKRTAAVQIRLEVGNRRKFTLGRNKEQLRVSRHRAI